MEKTYHKLKLSRIKGVLRYLIISFCSCFCLLSADRVYAQIPDKNIRQLDSLMQGSDDSGLSGTLFIQQGHQIIYQKNFGRDLQDSTKKFNDFSAFRAESFDEILISYAVLLLQQQGKLTIADSVSKFFPYAKVNASGITLEHLMLGAGGIDDKIVENQFSNETNTTIKSLLEKMPETVFKPGTSYMHSRTGFFILAKIIERAGEMRWTDFITENILKPAGLTQSKFTLINETNNTAGVLNFQFETCLNDLRKFYYGIKENVFLDLESVELSLSKRIPFRWKSKDVPPNGLCWATTYLSNNRVVHFLNGPKLSFQFMYQQNLLIISYNNSFIVNSFLQNLIYKVP